MKKVTLFISRAENQPGHYLVVVNGEGFFESVNNLSQLIRRSVPGFAATIRGSTTGSSALVAPASNVSSPTGVSPCPRSFLAAS